MGLPHERFLCLHPRVWLHWARWEGAPHFPIPISLTQSHAVVAGNSFSQGHHLLFISPVCMYSSSSLHGFLLFLPRMENQPGCHWEDVPWRRLQVTVGLSPTYLLLLHNWNFFHRGRALCYWTIHIQGGLLLTCQVFIPCLAVTGWSDLNTD